MATQSSSNLIVPDDPDLDEYSRRRLLLRENQWPVRSGDVDDGRAGRRFRAVRRRPVNESAGTGDCNAAVDCRRRKR